MSEIVDHPKHYTSSASGVEVIQLTETCSCCISNSLKYLARNGLKHSDTKVDLEKSRWYILREMDRLKSGRLTTDLKALSAFCSAEEDTNKARAIRLLATAENTDDLEEALEIVQGMLDAKLHQP